MIAAIMIMNIAQINSIYSKNNIIFGQCNFLFSSDQFSQTHCVIYDRE